MAINKRIFGTPITGSVRTKLEARQASGSFNTDVQFGQTIQVGGKDLTVKIPKNSELSSKTPFVRMWTSIKVIDPAVAADKIEEHSYSTTNGTIDHEESIKELNKRIQTQETLQGTS